ncbi:MAG: 2,3-bisphosphoglycerate-dependent phosphoglycerate mutase [Rhizobiales bacterium]|nr:2,3-bisphosphoglycerate-dependent phosphoglycerate mutase [Hyphomicrobiales bacterium]
MNNILTIIRHGESQWNFEKRFTGLSDIGLTAKGVEEAKQAGQILLDQNINYDMAFCSKLKRAKNTLDLVLETMQHKDIEIVAHKALNERDFGDITGKYHRDIINQYGQTQVDIWRNSYESAPPNGESLEDLADRCLPYFNSEILTQYQLGKNILIVAHSVTIRALLMQIKQISKIDIVHLSVKNGQPLNFILNKDHQFIQHSNRVATEI